MNHESHSHGDLARPATNPTAVIAAAPLDVARVVPLAHSGLARPAAATALSATSILRALQRRQLLALGVAILAAGIVRSGGLVSGSAREVQGPGPAASGIPRAQASLPHR